MLFPPFARLRFTPSPTLLQIPFYSLLHSCHLSSCLVALALTQFLHCSNKRCRGWGQDAVVSPCCAFLLTLFCSSTGPLWATVHLGISALPWSTSSSDLGVLSAFSHSLPPFSSTCPAFLPVFKGVFQEMPLVWLMGSVVSCGGSAGADWNWLYPVQGSLSTLLPAAPTLPSP